MLKLLRSNAFVTNLSQTIRDFFSKKAAAKEKEKRQLLKRTVVATYFLAWFLYFFYFWSNAFITNPSGGISAQHINLWGDWAVHFTMGSAMAERGLILASSPLLLNASFSYPFVANMISALLIRAGVEFTAAFVLPSFIFSCLVVVALFLFYKQLGKSTLLALFASCIFLFNGGNGFIYYFEDITASQDKLYTILNPPREYTNIESKHYRWIGVINSMVFPQRAFTFGFPIALIILTILLKVTPEKKQSKAAIYLEKVTQWFTLKWGSGTQKKRSNTPSLTLLLATATLTGLMPIIHTHSFLALFVIIAFWAVADITSAHSKQLALRSAGKWLIFGVTTSAIALPLIYMFIATTVGESFIKWFPGWYVGNQYVDETILSFWFKNWTIVPLLSTLGFLVLVAKSAKKRVAILTFLPFFVLFVLLNLVLFQPFIWDNTKILVWASVGFSFLTAYFLLFLWRLSHWLKPLVVAITITICLSGVLDVYRDIRFDLHSYQMYSGEEWALAEWVRQNTPTDSGNWLTGTYHNQWLFNLTGRQAVITYPGWLWTHGYNYYSEDAAVKQMYLFPNEPELYEKYDVRYIVVGPFERHNFETSESLFSAKQFKVLYQTPEYTLFERL